MEKITLEICIDSVAGAIAAYEGGADRLELCSGLAEGGVTPSPSLVREVVAATPLPVMCMIRPRGGGFQMTEAELRIMESDIGLLQDAGAYGVVFGVLDEKYNVDQTACARLLAAARPHSVTFHRAIDVAADLDRAMQTLVDLEFDRVLTSGQAVTAEKGLAEIQRLNERFGQNIIVMPGAGLSPRNARAIINASGVTEIHGSASSFSQYIAEPTVDGQPQRRKETDRGIVRKIRTALDE
ncbi:MAG: copper homeostasis protein CutC [Planctomycetota bacterium]